MPTGECTNDSVATPSEVKATSSMSSPKTLPKRRHESETGFASSPITCTGSMMGTMHHEIAERGLPAMWST